MMPSLLLVSLCLALAVSTQGKLPDDTPLTRRLPLCEALKYCNRGFMLMSLKERGSSLPERQFVVDKALMMNRRCSCHPSCNYFGTCCEDMKVSPKTVKVNSGSSSRCLGLAGGSGARIVDTCPAGTNTTMWKLCQGKDILNSKAAVYPMKVDSDASPYTTSALTELTYKNKYCAMCVGETEANLIEWTLTKDPLCVSKEAHMCKHHQTPPKGGMTYGDHFLSPGYYREYLYTFTELGDRDVCQADIIRTCPENTDTEMSNKCKGGRTVVVQDVQTEKVYANLHCAICNKVTTFTTCESLSLIMNDAVSSTTSYPSSSTSEVPEDVEWISSTSSTSSTSTTTESADDFLQDVTGTSTSSTSSTSTTSSPLPDVSNSEGNELTAGEGFPSGTVIGTNTDVRGSVLGTHHPSGTVIGTQAHPRGTVIDGAQSGCNDTDTVEDLVVVGHGDGESFPHGTVLTPDGDNPRGLVSNLDESEDEEGAELPEVIMDTDSPRGYIISRERTTNRATTTTQASLRERLQNAFAMLQN